MTKKNMFGFMIMLLAIVFFMSSFVFAADVVDAAVADFNYCPDGTMVESLADCSKLTDELLVNDIRPDNARLLVSGDEYGFVTAVDAKATIKTSDGELFFVDTKIMMHYLDKSSPLLAKAVNADSDLAISCGVSDTNEIVCKSNHLENDEGGTVFCWGNNELRECPDVEIETSRGGGAGKVSIQDIKIESTSSQGGDGPESSIEAYYQGILTQSTDPDDDSVALSYVWSLHGGPGSSDEPSEDVRLSFSKIEVKYSVEDSGDGSGGSILVDVPEMSVSSSSLIFTTLFFSNVLDVDGNERPDLLELLFSTPAAIPPRIRGIAVDSPFAIADNLSDYADVDDDGDGILTKDASSRGPLHRDIALSRAFITDSSGSTDEIVPVIKRARPSMWSDEDRARVKTYVDSLDSISDQDFGLAIALAASENPRVREVRYNDETNIVEVEHEEDVKLLGFIPVLARATTTLDVEGREETKYPWWATFATKTENKVKFKAGAELSKGVN